MIKTAATAILAALAAAYSVPAVHPFLAGLVIAAVVELAELLVNHRSREVVWLTKLMRGQCPRCDHFAMAEVTSVADDRRLCCNDCGSTFSITAGEHGLDVERIGKATPQ